MNRKQVLKGVGIVFGILALVLVSLIVWASWRGDSTEIVTKADDLAIPSDWKLTSEKIIKPQNFCLEKSGCPSVERRYESTRMLDKRQFQEVLGWNGENTDILGECEIPSENVSGSSISICGGERQIDDHYYSVSQTTDDSRQIFRFRITISERIEK